MSTTTGDFRTFALEIDRRAMLPLLVAWLLVAGCGGRKLVGTDVSYPTAGNPALHRGTAYLHVTRRHYKTYHVEGSAVVSALSGIGTNDLSRTETETTKIDSLATIAVDLKSGRCTRLSPTSPGKHPPDAAAWTAPVAMANGHTTPTGLRIFHADGHVRVVDPQLGTRSAVADDPAGRAKHLLATNAIVFDGQLLDVVSGTIWRYHTGIARLGDRLFVPTPGRGIVELTAAPIVEVAQHAPHSVLPADLSWLATRPWRAGDTYQGVELIVTAEGQSLRRGDWSLFVGPGDRPLVVYENDKLAAGDGVLVDLVGGTSTTKVRGYPRIARTSGEQHELLLESGGSFWEGSSRLTELRPLRIDLRPIGFNSGMLVFRGDNGVSLLVFDLATRGWRDISYAECIATPP